MERIDLNELSIKQLTELYNLAALKHVNKFSNKEVAVRRLTEELKEHGLFVGTDVQFHYVNPKNGNGAGATTEKAKTAPAAKSEASEASEAGKRSTFAARKIFLVGKAKETNPRRAGTNGWKSMEIVRKNDGIRYEDYVKAGGRRNDLAWDLAHGYVTVK